MLATLAEIRNAVRFRGDYSNTRKFSDVDLNNEIQKSFAEFYELVDSVNEGWWDTQGTVTTTANVAYVALPTGTWRVHAVDRLDGTVYESMDQVGRSLRNAYDNSTGKPQAYRLTARGIDLLPTPDAVYTIRVLYTPTAPLLVESQPRDFLNSWDDFVIVSTLLKLDAREQRPLNDRLTVLAALEARIKAGASQRKQQEPEYLNLREGFGDFWDDEVWR